MSIQHIQALQTVVRRAQTTRGFGMEPQGVAAMRVQQGRSQKQSYCPARTWTVGTPRNQYESGWLRTWDDPSPPPAAKVVKVCVPNCSPGEVLNLMVGQHTLVPESDPYFVAWLIGTVQKGLTPAFRCIPGESSAYAPSRGAIDQNAPLPQRSPFVVSQALTAARPSNPLTMMQPSLTPSSFQVPMPVIPTCPGGQVVWVKYKNNAVALLTAGLLATFKSNPAARANVASFYCDYPPAQVGKIGVHGTPHEGLGANPSAFTLAAAQALDAYLAANGCAGCDDITSHLRSLTFAFKAAYLTDQNLPAVNMNMSTTLAMTAYGAATDGALSAVLGSATRTYKGGPCTDDMGNCTPQTNLVTPSIPAAIQALEQQLAHQIQQAIQQVQYTPQPELVSGLVQGFAALINQVGFELAKLKNPIPIEATPPPPPALPVTKTTTTTTGAQAPSGWTTGEKVAAGVAAGAAVVGIGFLLYHAGKKG